ncbi:MAG TPA: glycosyltransferase family 4 protein [Gemmatimonadaceae bacterium]|nr:glycosyltransferase family 4 protein [Gemmatimonadaceae bacterium]
MRVAYVCADPGVPVFGTKGSSVHVQEVVRALLGRDAEVEIFATRFDGEPPEDLRTAGIHWLSALPKGNIAARERASLGANRGLSAMLRGAGPFDLVYERYSLWSYAGMEHAQEQGVPGVLEVNAPLIDEQEKHRGLVDRGSAEGVAQRVFDAASTIVAVSREVASYLDRFPGARDRVHVVPNGVNAERFTPDIVSAYPHGGDEFTVGFVGTLKPWHGLPVLVDAFSTLYRLDPQSRLIIGGDGPERATLETALNETGSLSATTFTGAIDPAAVPALLTSFDAAVAPYPANADFYFSPLKVYEYMSSGLPVVASAIGQIPEIIEHEVNGILCEAGDAGAFAKVLSSLSRSPDLRERLGRAARESVIRSHTWPMVVDRILSLAEQGAASRVPAAMEA